MAEINKNSTKIKINRQRRETKKKKNRSADTSNGDSERHQEMEENRGSFDRATIPHDDYDDDTPFETPPRPLNYHRSIDNCYVLCPRDGQERAASFYIESIEFANEFNNRLCPSYEQPRRAKMSKQGRSNSVVDQRRRSSVQSNRSRTNSCGRPTPLGRRQLGHRTFPIDGNTRRRCFLIFR